MKLRWQGRYFSIPHFSISLNQPSKAPAPWSTPLNANRYSGTLKLTRCYQNDPFAEVSKMRKRRSASAATTRSMRSKGRRASVDQFWLEFVGGLGGISAEEMSEDCLNLNVWTPLQKDGNMLVLFLGFVSLSVCLSCSIARKS